MKHLHTDRIIKPSSKYDKNSDKAGMKIRINEEIELTTYSKLREDFKRILRKKRDPKDWISDGLEDPERYFKRPRPGRRGSFAVAWGRIILDEVEEVHDTWTGTGQAVFYLLRESMIGLINLKTPASRKRKRDY